MQARKSLHDMGYAQFRSWFAPKHTGRDAGVRPCLKAGKTDGDPFSPAFVTALTGGTATNAGEEEAARSLESETGCQAVHEDST